MNYSNIISVFVFFLLSLKVVNAETIKDERTKKFRVCMENVDLSAMKNSQWLNCYMEEFARQDEFLKKEYQNLISKVPTESKANLIKAQKLWSDFRNRWCAFEETLPMAPNPYVNQAACLVEITIEQKNKLKNTYRNL